jgi:hypothetical protein
MIHRMQFAPSLWFALATLCFVLTFLTGPTVFAQQSAASPNHQVGGRISESISPLPPSLPTGATLNFGPGTTVFAITNNVSTTVKAAYNIGTAGFTLGCYTTVAPGVVVPTPGTFTATIPAGNGSTGFACPAASDRIALTCGNYCTMLFVP